MHRNATTLGIYAYICITNKELDMKQQVHNSWWWRSLDR